MIRKCASSFCIDNFRRKIKTSHCCTLLRIQTFSDQTKISKINSVNFFVTKETLEMSVFECVTLFNFIIMRLYQSSLV